MTSSSVEAGTDGRLEMQRSMLLAEFPLLCWESDEMRALCGVFTSGRREFFVRMVCPDGPMSLESASLLCCEQLEEILKDEMQQVTRMLRRPHEDAVGFLTELRNLCERILSKLNRAAPRSSPALSSLPAAQFYRALLDELDRVGWERVEELDNSLTRLRLKVTDSGSRTHTVQVDLDADYPAKLPAHTAPLPSAVEVEWAGEHPIVSILEAYEKAVAGFERLFDVLDDFDEYTWVLEPERPTRSETFRKVVVSKHASLLVDLDPANPMESPECRFFGSETAIAPLRRRLDDRLHLWDSTILPRNNLEAILETQFVSKKQSGSNEEMAFECGICYAFRLEDHGIPDIACDHVACSRPFHRFCMFEWLRSVPDTRQSFDTLFGQCPYCSKPISVRA